MSIAIGIEGGGTRTRILFRQGAGEAVYVEEPLSIKVLGDDYRASVETLRTLIERSIGEGTNFRIAMGLAGMHSLERRAEFEQHLREDSMFRGARIEIQGDASLTLDASLASDPYGAIAIVGTGSVVFGKSPQGAHRYGGRGPIVSDGGSGQWIGLRALRHWMLGYDVKDMRDELYRAVATLLPTEFREHPHLIERKAERDPQFSSRFAPAVFETRHSSPASDAVLEEAAGEIAALIRAALKSMNAQKSVPIVLAGSIAKHATIRELLTEKLSGAAVEIRVLDELAPVRRALEIAEALSD